MRLDFIQIFLQNFFKNFPFLLGISKDKMGFNFFLKNASEIFLQD